MMQRFHGGFRSDAIYVLALTCVLVPAALARQQASSSDSSTPKPSTSNTTAKHPTAAKPSTASHTSHTASTKHSSKKKKVTRVRGQQKIDSERARTIQEALIREHYLNGDPTGNWDQDSEEAMRRYQGDHGWQTKEVPDSRALIKLGLGPGTEHLLNPESAMTTAPPAPRSDAPLPTSHSATPAAVTPQNPAQSNPPTPQ